MHSRRTLLLLAAVITAAAQTPAFEVASVRPEEITADLYIANLGRVAHGQLSMGNVTLSEAVRFAWGINNDAQVAGPDWIKSKGVRYKIDAKAAPDTPREQVLLMLQTLLIERFQIKSHVEQREIAHLELSPGKKELKIRPAEEGAVATATGNGYGHISNPLTMGQLTTVLSRFLRQPIVLSFLPVVPHQTPCGIRTRRRVPGRCHTPVLPAMELCPGASGRKARKH